MSMIIKTNINSLNANRKLSINNSKVSKSLEKLATGYSINRASDDASGLAISEKMRSQITGLDQGTENCLEGVSLVQTAEGALEEVHNMLNRIYELCVKSANGTIQDEVDREAIQLEVDALITEIDRIAVSTNYNGIPLLTGTTYDVLIDTVTDVNLVRTNYTSYTYLDVNSGVSSANSLETTSSSYYKSDSVSLASGATSVPAGNSLDDSDLPYVIKMEIVSYNENTGAIDESVVSITVNRDADTGAYSVIGSNGVDYIGKAYQTAYDSYLESNGIASPGYIYVSDIENAGITTSEVSIIMETLLNSINTDTGTDLNAGGSTYFNVSVAEMVANVQAMDARDGTDLYNSIFVNVFNGDQLSYPYFPSGSGYSYGSFVSGSNLAILSSTSTTGVSVGNSYYYSHSSSTSQYESYYTSYSVSSYSSAYADGMSIYNTSASYTNSGRVLGVLSTVTQGGNVTSYAGSPSGFNPNYWLTPGVNINNLANNTILGILAVAESPRSEVQIPEPVTNADVAGMSAEQLADFVVTINKLTIDYPELDYQGVEPSGYTDVEIIEKYVTVYDGFVDTNPSMFGEDVTVIYGNPGDESYEIIDTLCSRISSDFGISRVTRKTDDTSYDISTDANLTDKYTLQIGVFSSSKYGWSDPFDVDVYETIDDPIIIQAADKGAEYNKIKIFIDDTRIEALGLTGLNVSTQENAGISQELVKNAINYVSLNRADIGAMQNRLEYTINNNNNTSENMSAARSAIKDCDMASEMMEYTKNNILVQSAQAMLAQANQVPQSILSLLG